MQSEKPSSAAKVVFAIFFLSSVLVPARSQAQTFKVLHTFHGPDGAEPLTQLSRDAAGDFYGTTTLGGEKCPFIRGVLYRCGTVFKLDKTGKQVWLHSFNGADGALPSIGVLRDAAGNLYGTTVLGGDTKCYTYGCGTVFRLDAAGKETLLYEFRNTYDGEEPESLLVEDTAGSLYGTTYEDGMGAFGDGGTVFRVDADGNKTLLYSFCSETNCEDGQFPSPGVIRDASGNIYGVTDAGGADGQGTVFELDTTGKETVLYSFTGGADGGRPGSVLIADSEGNLYGTTEGGGKGCGTGCGVVFELSPQGKSWTENVLYTFCSLSNCADGEEPDRGPLVRDAAGNLYGTTLFGGTHQNCNGSCGVVFKLDTAGKETVLHSFTGGADGASPGAGLIMDKAGNLYGTTGIGGDAKCPAGHGHGCGVVFELTR